MSTATEQSIYLLSRALDQAGEVLATVPADALSAATPCGDWDVARLVAHVVAAPRHFVTMSSGGEPDWSAQPPLPDDWAAEFRSAAADLLRMWRDAGESASPQTMDWQTAELAVHTWDLVHATSQSKQLDSEVAERGLTFMSAALTPQNRGDAFGPEVPLADDAPAYDRLVAFAGRDPRKRPPRRGRDAQDAW